MQTQLYSADQVSIIFGVAKLEGYGPDTFVKVERNEESFTLKAGADGEIARTRNLNHSGKVTCTLLQTSASNKILQVLLIADEKSPNGASIVPLMVKDNSGNALWVAAEAWISKPASTEGAREVGTREWTIECANLQPPLGL